MPWSELVKLYRVHDRPNLKPRYNIAPSQDILVIRLDQEGQQEAESDWRRSRVDWWTADDAERILLTLP
jgi:putative SOS response-associated peptidase YedK